MQLAGESEVYRRVFDDGRVLICRDEGAPYDNLLHVYLQDRDGEIVDALEAGALMADGIFRVVGEDCDRIDFTYFLNHETYRLEIRETGRPALFPFLPFGFRYKRRFARHFLTVKIWPVTAKKRMNTRNDQQGSQERAALTQFERAANNVEMRLAKP